MKMGRERLFECRNFFALFEDDMLAQSSDRISRVKLRTLPNKNNKERRAKKVRDKKRKEATGKGKIE